MKRLNPETNQPFERGYKREDGRYFFQYTISKVKRNGFFREKWASKETLDNYRNKQKEVKKIHAKNNPDKINAKTNKRRSKKLQRIPGWADLKKIEEYYNMAKELQKVFPWRQHVDHIVPLNGKNVSGFHVHYNLQILSQKANQEKGNKHVEENTATPVPTRANSSGEVYPEHWASTSAGFRQDGDDPDDHSRAIRGEDTDHRAQESSGDSLGRRGKEVGAPKAPQSLQDNGDTRSTYHWIED